MYILYISLDTFTFNIVLREVKLAIKNGLVSHIMPHESVHSSILGNKITESMNICSLPFKNSVQLR